jgi:hypothetical protein
MTNPFPRIGKQGKATRAEAQKNRRTNAATDSGCDKPDNDPEDATDLVAYWNIAARELAHCQETKIIIE